VAIAAVVTTGPTAFRISAFLVAVTIYLVGDHRQSTVRQEVSPLAHFLFADGSVRFLTYSADSILPALATRAGGEVVELP
jgi:prepilin-type processing-associated H-X9-DG protein